MLHLIVKMRMQSHTCTTKLDPKLWSHPRVDPYACTEPLWSYQVLYTQHAPWPREKVAATTCSIEEKLKEKSRKPWRSSWGTWVAVCYPHMPTRHMAAPGTRCCSEVFWALCSLRWNPHIPLRVTPSFHQRRMGVESTQPFAELSLIFYMDLVCLEN